MTSSSRDLEVSGKPDAVFSCHSETSQNTFSDRDRSKEPGNRFESSVHSVFRFADAAHVGKSLLDGNKDHCCRQLQKYVRIQNFCWGYGKTISFREIGYEYFLTVLRHGRSCKEVRGKMLRTGKQNNATIKQSRMGCVGDLSKVCSRMF